MFKEWTYEEVEEKAEAIVKVNVDILEGISGMKKLHK